jgi:hypothetical protein
VPDRCGPIRSCAWTVVALTHASNTLYVVLDSRDALLMRLSGLVSQRIKEDVCERA